MQRKPLTRDRFVNLIAIGAIEGAVEAVMNITKGAGFALGVIYVAKKTGVLPLKK